MAGGSESQGEGLQGTPGLPGSHRWTAWVVVACAERQTSLTALAAALLHLYCAASAQETVEVRVPHALSAAAGDEAKAAQTCEQCFFFSRNIGYVTPKIIYFHSIKNLFWIKVSKK